MDMLKGEQLQAIKERFQYFAFWSDEQVTTISIDIGICVVIELDRKLINSQMIECGKLAKLHTYRPHEIIYAGDGADESPVYFVLNGECAIFQCVRVSVSDQLASFK